MNIFIYYFLPGRAVYTKFGACKEAFSDFLFNIYGNIFDTSATILSYMKTIMLRSFIANRLSSQSQCIGPVSLTLWNHITNTLIFQAPFISDFSRVYCLISVTRQVYKASWLIRSFVFFSTTLLLYLSCMSCAPAIPVYFRDTWLGAYISKLMCTSLFLLEKKENRL